VHHPEMAGLCSALPIVWIFTGGIKGLAIIERQIT